MKNREDNFKMVRQSVAKMILDSELSNWVGYRDSSSRLNSLKAIASGEDDGDSSWNFLSTNFRKVGTDVSLDISLDNIDSRVIGEEYWVEYKLVCNVNWPCHGGSDCLVALTRLEFYRQVAALASDIQVTFPVVFKMKPAKTKDNPQS